MASVAIGSGANVAGLQEAAEPAAAAVQGPAAVPAAAPPPGSLSKAQRMMLELQPIQASVNKLEIHVIQRSSETRDQQHWDNRSRNLIELLLRSLTSAFKVAKGVVTTSGEATIGAIDEHLVTPFVDLVHPPHFSTLIDEIRLPLRGGCCSARTKANTQSEPLRTVAIPSCG